MITLRHNYVGKSTVTFFLQFLSVPALTNKTMIQFITYSLTVCIIFLILTACCWTESLWLWPNKYGMNIITG